MVVVLPAPFGPEQREDFALATSKATSFTASMSPYRLLRCSTETAITRTPPSSVHSSSVVGFVLVGGRRLAAASTLPLHGKTTSLSYCLSSCPIAFRGMPEGCSARLQGMMLDEHVPDRGPRNALPPSRRRLWPLATLAPGADRWSPVSSTRSAISVLGHVFVANMTGNVVFLAFALVGGTGLLDPGLDRGTRCVRHSVRSSAGGCRSTLAQHRARLLSTCTMIQAFSWRQPWCLPR